MAEVKNICLEALERRCESGDVGRLDLRRGDYAGEIYTSDQRIVHAVIGGLEGIPALFRLFDWGDADTTWQTGQVAEKPLLNLTMEEASTLYAENLQDRSELQAKEKERIDQAFLSPEAIAGSTLGVESVLKHYNISLTCKEPGVLPDGFIFSDAAKSSYVIGSSDDADVVLRHPSVEALHCGVILESGTVLVWDLGAQSGVKINGNPITQEILKVGDTMTLGTLDLRVRFQLRRPTIRLKTADGQVTATTTASAQAALTGTLPLPKLEAPPPKEVIPKGPITYAKVAKQLRKTGGGNSFLDKLGSLFNKKK